MYVAAADAARFDANQKFIGARARQGHVGQLEAIVLGEQQRFHVRMVAEWRGAAGCGDRSSGAAGGHGRNFEVAEGLADAARGAAGDDEGFDLGD